MFNSIAYAQEAAAAAQPQGPMGALGGFLPIIIIFVIFYFLLIRPQSKRQKAHAAMIEAIKSGDTVVTSAGFIGTVSSVEGNVVVLDLGATKVRIMKSAIADKIDPETFNVIENDTTAKKEKEEQKGE